MMNPLNGLSDVEFLAVTLALTVIAMLLAWVFCKILGVAVTLALTVIAMLLAWVFCKILGVK